LQLFIIYVANKDKQRLYEVNNLCETENKALKYENKALKKSNFLISE